MRKRPFLLFSLIVSLLVAVIVAFIQSAGFAGIVKGIVARNAPADLGIVADFSAFSIKLFPPGVSINEPKISLTKNNVLGLPEDSRVTADRIDLTFLPFQIFSGNIRVSRVTI